jgi:acetyltransferase
MFMDFFFNPKGIAVVGATPESNHGGNNLVANLALGFKGPIYPVNPKHREILGLKCYPRVSDIEGPLDLALIFIPAQAVPQVLKDCIKKEVRGAIVESGGFAEVGPEGKALQDQCLDIARKGRLRIWGPNCTGLVDTSKQYFFSFIVPEAWKGTVNPGHVSLIVQSGLLSAGFITTLMSKKIVGIAKACSIGNKCDVEESELLEYLLKDPETKVIALYLESFINGRRFFELASSSDKPIVVLKGGKSPLGAEALVSHTASLAGNYDLVNGVLRQAGVHQADDFFEMVDIARTLEREFCLRRSPDEKPRMAILSFSGSSGIVTTDHMEKYGLTFAPLSPLTVKRLKELSPPWMPIKNPVDYWPAIERHGPALAYKNAIEALHDDPEVDGIIVHLFTRFEMLASQMKETMSGIKNPRKPILFWLIGPEKGREPTRLALEEEGWPTFYEIHRAVKVMASLFENCRERRKLLEISPSDFQIPDKLRELVCHREKQEAKVLDEHEAKNWFKAIGLKIAEEAIIKDIDEAIKVANEIGYPIVLKGRVEGQVHKTEAGLVKLNLINENQLKSAYQEMVSLKTEPKSFMIQPMLRGDLELITGIMRDPQFGLAAMLGFGGVWTEVYKDVVFRLVPLDREEIFGMASGLKGHVLLQGYRGSKPVNMESLGDWLIKLGWLAMNFEKIKEIDVNPLLIVNGEPVAVDATIILS